MKRFLKDSSCHLFKYGQVETTMQLAEHFPDKHAYLDKGEMLAFQASTMTAGRGQRKNTWEAPLGNLYITYVLRTQ
jgi:biotin-(acetyl-CoA carboxylase) ligase